MYSMVHIQLGTWLYVNRVWHLIVFRYDRFQDAFEHVSTIIDDIYKVLYYLVHFAILCCILYLRNCLITPVHKLSLDQRMLRYMFVRDPRFQSRVLGGNGDYSSMWKYIVHGHISHTALISLYMYTVHVGTIFRRHQLQLHSSREKVPSYGQPVWRREDGCSSRTALLYTQVP